MNKLLAASYWPLAWLVKKLLASGCWLLDSGYLAARQTLWLDVKLFAPDDYVASNEKAPIIGAKF